MNKILAFFAVLYGYAQVLQAQQPRPLPDPLILTNGSRVTSAKQWRTQRRPELLALFASQMYGHSPGRPAQMRFAVFDTDPKALGGKATRKQVAVFFDGKPDHKSPKKKKDDRITVACCCVFDRLDAHQRK